MKLQELERASASSAAIQLQLALCRPLLKVAFPFFVECTQQSSVTAHLPAVAFTFDRSLTPSLGGTIWRATMRCCGTALAGVAGLG